MLIIELGCKEVGCGPPEVLDLVGGLEAKWRKASCTRAGGYPCPCFHTLSGAIPNDNYVVNVASIVDDLGSKGVVVYDMLAFPITHDKVCIAWGKTGPHSCALGLQIKGAIKFKLCFKQNFVASSMTKKHTQLKEKHIPSKNSTTIVCDLLSNLPLQSLLCR